MSLMILSKLIENWTKHQQTYVIIVIGDDWLWQ